MVNPLFESLFQNRKDKNSISQWLSECPVFSRLNSRELLFMEKIVHLRQFRKNEHFFKQGEAGIGMFLITSGSVLVSDGTSETELTEGDFFGELALVEENSRRTAEAVAKEDTTAIGFFKPDLEEIKERNSVVGVKILTGLSSVLATRLRETIKRRRAPQ